jgi:hypothetical protein
LSVPLIHSRHRDSAIYQRTTRGFFSQPLPGGGIVPKPMARIILYSIPVWFIVRKDLTLTKAPNYRSIVFPSLFFGIPNVTVDRQRFPELSFEAN